VASNYTKLKSLSIVISFSVVRFFANDCLKLNGFVHGIYCRVLKNADNLKFTLNGSPINASGFVVFGNLQRKRYFQLKTYIKKC